MEVRPATLAEASALARVHVAAWRTAYAGVMPDAYLAGLDEARFTLGWESVLDDGTTFVGLSDEGVLDGFVTVGDAHDDGPATGELWALNVHPEAFGSGLGTLLHTAALARLAADGHESAYLWVARDNPRARRFYEREGWVADGGAKDDVFGGASVPEIRYVRSLRE